MSPEVFVRRHRRRGRIDDKVSTGRRQTRRINDEERRQWIDNDEGLYNEHRRSGLSKQEFIRRYRDRIDEVISNIVEGRERASYLEYDVDRDPLVKRLFVRRHPDFKRHLFPRSVLRVAVDEARDILRCQERVLGYESEAQAKQVRRGLLQRGIRTEVVVEVGPPIRKPQTWQEARAIRDTGVVPGTRYAIWGIRLMR